MEKKIRFEFYITDKNKELLSKAAEATGRSRGMILNDLIKENKNYIKKC